MQQLDTLCGAQCFCGRLLAKAAVWRTADARALLCAWYAWMDRNSRLCVHLCTCKGHCTSSQALGARAQARPNHCARSLFVVSPHVARFIQPSMPTHAHGR